MPSYANLCATQRVVVTSAAALFAVLSLACSNAKCPSGTAEINSRCKLLSEVNTAGNSGTGVSGDSQAGAGEAATEPDRVDHAGTNASGGMSGSASRHEAGSGEGSPGKTAGEAGSSVGGGGSAPTAAGPICGNGVREVGEFCDGSDCVSTCETMDACLVVVLEGASATCDARCSNPAEIAHCTSGDGCCAKGCTYAVDTDCSKSCGDGAVDEPELCEPTNTEKQCPTSCDDADPCTLDIKTGTPEQCNVACSHATVTIAKNSDTCCPKGANANVDNDCSPVCGNGVVEDGETCDGNCPSCMDDGDPCTMETSSGSANRCNVTCSKKAVTAPRSGDGCCPQGATIATDIDCKARCGDGVVTAPEKCDPMSSERKCPTRCTEGSECVRVMLVGSAVDCTSECLPKQITSAANNDGCCPDGQTISTDNDCKPYCGDGVVTAGEKCDPKSSAGCPRSCNDDGNPCTDDRATGSDCTLTCEHRRLPEGTSCGSREACSASGKCEAQCGNGKLDPGEKCDPMSTDMPCPSLDDCDDGDACTSNALNGSYTDCSAHCAAPVRTCPICEPDPSLCDPGTGWCTSPDCLAGQLCHPTTRTCVPFPQ